MTATAPSQSTASSSVVFKRPDRYEVDRESALKRAQTGSMFEAYDTLLDQPAVLRLLRPGVGDKASKKRFERKARKLCQLNHPNLVPINDFGYHHGIAYVARDRVDGTRLDEYIEANGPLEFREFAPIASAVLEGIAELHQFQVVHGDIQPENVWLEVQAGAVQNARIAGFGLPDLEANSEDDVEEKTRRLERTPAVAPERIEGEGADERIDLYGLGVTAYYMLSGHHPFGNDEDGLEALYQHLHEHPPLLSEEIPPGHDVPEVIVEFVHRLMAKNPDDRPSNGEEAVQWFVESVADKRVFRFERDLAPTPETHPESGSAVAISPEDLTAERPSWTHEQTSGSFPSVLRPGDLEATPRGDGRAVSESSVSKFATRMKTWAIPETTGGAVGAVVLVALAVAGGLYAFTATDDHDSEAAGNAAATAETPDTREQISRKQFRKRLTGVAQAIDNREFKTAQSLLTSLQSDLRNPEFLKITERYSTRIRAGKKLNHAERLEKKAEIREAMRTYEDVLELLPNHERASNRRKQLQSSFGLRITANVRASVFVDGKLIGTTPIRKILPTDKSRLTIRRFGYEIWRRSISPDEADVLEYSVQLERKTEPKPSSRETLPANDAVPQPNDEPFGGDQLMEMDEF